jgi:hypothetical protein
MPRSRWSTPTIDRFNHARPRGHPDRKKPKLGEQTQLLFSREHLSRELSPESSPLCQNARHYFSRRLSPTTQSLGHLATYQVERFVSG